MLEFGVKEMIVILFEVGYNRLYVNRLHLNSSPITIHLVYFQTIGDLGVDLLSFRIDFAVLVEDAFGRETVLVDGGGLADPHGI